MLSRFIEREGFIPIPLTGGKFLIDVNGNCLNAITGEINQSGKNDLVSFFDGVTFHQLKRSVVVCLAFKPLHFKVSNYLLFDTLPIDGNENNVFAGNLVWKYPLGGLVNVSNTDYAHIPGFSRYSINKNGLVYSHLTRKHLSWYKDQSGYLMYGVTPDVGKRTIVGMHRLLALAFLEYPANVDDLDVNHIDGVKDNCVLTNLEWASRKGNCLHAYKNGLRDDNVCVLSRNSFTGETDEHYSIQDCARAFGVSGATIFLRLASSGQQIYPPGYQFKRKDDPCDWKIFSDPKSELMRNGLSRKLSFRNTITGKVIAFESLTTAATFFNIKRHKFADLLKSETNLKLGNFLLESK